jgi:hypothetical protein
MTTRRLAAFSGFVFLLSAITAAQGQQATTATVVGYVWTANNSPVVSAQVQLRDVRSGTVAFTGRTTETGAFSFTRVTPGQYVVEYVTGADGTVTAVGQPFTVTAGESVATFVRTGNRSPTIVSGTEPQAAAKPDPREDAETAVAFAIRLLEAGDHKMFLSQFMTPDELKARAGTPESLETFAQAFGAAGRADRLLAALKNARTKTPVYDQAKTTATFQLDPLPNTPNTMVLVKVGPNWYLSNK